MVVALDGETALHRLDMVLADAVLLDAVMHGLSGFDTCRRIKANPSRRLTIVTALSLEKPFGKSELERHFLEPLVERVFGDYPDLDYVKDGRGSGLPPNISVREFFMKTGDYLGNAAAQQNYISTNYTFVARDMLLQGMNVIASAVAEQGEGEAWRLSLSSNPDVAFEVVEKYAAQGLPLLKVGVVNRKMPFMPNKDPRLKSTRASLSLL